MVVFAAAAPGVPTAPVAAARFYPKLETLKEITLEAVGEKSVPQEDQVIRITNLSIHDLKEIGIPCSYLSESGMTRTCQNRCK
jgi:hypothetical protein